MRVGVIARSFWPINRTVRFGKLAEELGFDCCWINSTPTSRDSFIILSAIALNTENIRVGTSVTDIHLRHPIVLAGAISSLYEISDGRADLGLTGGGIPNLHGRLGVEWTDLPNKSREAVILIKRLLKGERVVHKGKYYSIDDLQLQAPQRNVRVLLAAHAPRMINVAAEVADGMIMIKGPLEFQKFLLGTYEKTLKELKRPRWSGHTVMESVVIVDNDRKTAYDRARPFAAEMVSHYNLVYKPPRESLAMKALGLTREQGEYYQQNPQELPDEIIPKVTICGSVEDCISQIKELKQLGLDEFYCWYPEYGIEQLITTDLIKSREQLIRDVGGMLLPEVQKI